MHDCAWLLFLLCTVARFGYLLRILERPRRGYVVSTCARDAESGCVTGLGKRASEFRGLGVEEPQSEAQCGASAVIQRRHPAVVRGQSRIPRVGSH